MKLSMTSLAVFMTFQLSWGAPAASPIDYESFLGQHDMVWDRVPHRWEVSPYTGNGNVGFLFYQAERDARNVISIHVGRHDYYDHRLPHEGDENLWIYRSRLPLGRFNLQSEGRIESADLRLSLWDAEVAGTIRTDRGSYKLRGLTHSLDDVIYFETDASDGESIQISWHPEAPMPPVRTTLDAGGGPKGGSWDRMRKAPLPMPPAPTLSNSDGMRFCFQPLHDHRGETTTGWRIFGKADGRQVLTASVHHSFPERNSLATVKRTLLKAKASLLDESFLPTHRQWWHDYYPLSFLTVNDPEKEAFYWIQMYKFASATRGNGPVMDLMGPWYHKTFWPMVWGDLNVELQYWTHLTANRLDVGSSLPNWFDKHEQQLFRNVPDHWEDSAGLATLFPQDLVAHQGASVPDMLCWILHDYWLHCEFAGDRERMRDGLFPKLRATVNSYRNYLKDNPVRSKDGKIHIKNSWSPEYPGGRGQDINFTIGLMRWSLQTLLDINAEHQLKDPLAGEWQGMLDRLVEFQVDENGLRIGKDVPFDKPHRHYSHLLPFYPLAVLKPDTEEGSKLLRTTLDHWLDVTFNRKNDRAAMAVTGYTATGAASMYAMLGDAKQAYHYLDYFIQHDRVSPTTMYAEGNPVIESPLSFATCIHDMLLQSWGGRIRVFPGAPEQWKDVAFHQLRTQGAFLVSAKKRDGVTEFVMVESLIGSPCVLRADIADPVISINGTAAGSDRVRRTDDGFHELALKKGDIATFSRLALAQTDLSIQPIPVSGNERNLFGFNKKTERLPGHQHYGGANKSKRSGQGASSPPGKAASGARQPMPPSRGRFVRIEIPGKSRVLSLAEVEVYEAETNIAQGRGATQSSTVYGGVAGRAVDGNTDGDYNHDSVTHTSPDGNDPWWEVDLGRTATIKKILIHNRRGNSDRLDGFSLQILDDDRKPVFSRQGCRAAPLTEFFSQEPASSNKPLSSTKPAPPQAPNDGSWIIDSEAEWTADSDSVTNLEIKDGMATPTAEVAEFRSVLKRFKEKRAAESIALDQSPIWENWEPIENIGPNCDFDSPVFLSLGPDNYWFFARHNRGAEVEAREAMQEKFVAESVQLDGFEVPLLTTPIANQFRAPGGLRKGLGGYHAWQSRNMVNWVHHGPITDKNSAWMTTAEYADGKAYFYYDFPNDQDPHLIIDDDLTDGIPGDYLGMAFDDPSHGSDCVFIRDLDGNFHVIYEDWSPIHANSHSFDSPLAGHAVSKDGKGDFEILPYVIDRRTNPTGVIKTYKHPHWVKECPERFTSDLGEYEVHEPEQEAFGDWSAICIGGQYYLFGDYDKPHQKTMSVARFTSSSLDQEFTFCGSIGEGHPDPDVCFAEGRFYLATQMKTDYVSPGPWVERVDLRVGVDTANDATVDHWTDWQTVREGYDYTPGFAKHVRKTPASVDLSQLPEGFGFQFELRLTDTTKNPSKPIMDRVRMTFRP